MVTWLGYGVSDAQTSQHDTDTSATAQITLRKTAEDDKTDPRMERLERLAPTSRQLRALNVYWDRF